MRRSKILIVDDESALRTLIARELTDAGWAVLQANDGLQALEAIDRPGNGIDLVITDIRMPGMDGYELADRLSQRSTAMPMIFVSGFGQGGISLPGSVFLKPFVMEELFQEVRRLLDPKAGGVSV
jgi:CheY-like chemotaxis protein